jgi:hypothetical protein
MNSPETDTDGRPQAFVHARILPAIREEVVLPSVNTSCPSTLMADDVTSIKDVPDRPLRDGEFPIAEVPRIKPEDLIVRDKLGMSDKWWDQTKIALCEKYGELMALDLKLPRVLITHEICSYDQLDRAQRQCVEIAENDTLPAKDRLEAAQMLGYLADIGTKKAKQLLELGEKATHKVVEQKKRNLPPNATMVQVNVNPGTPQAKPAPPLNTSRPAPKQVKMAAG